MDIVLFQTAHYYHCLWLNILKVAKEISTANHACCSKRSWQSESVVLLAQCCLCLCSVVCACAVSFILQPVPGLKKCFKWLDFGSTNQDGRKVGGELDMLPEHVKLYRE
jgi:hypothetical protein